MHGRQHGNRFFCHVDAREDTRRLGDARQPLLDNLGPQVLEVQVDVIRLGTDAATLADFDGHGTTDDIAGRQVLCVRCIAFHEALAVGIGEVASLAAHALRYQATRAIDARRVKLYEFHVLHREARTQDHTAAIAGARMCRRARKIGAAVATGREDDLVRTKAMQPAGRQVDRNDAATRAIFHDQVDGKVLDVKLGIVLERLLVKRVQHRMPGAIGRGASSLRRALAIVRRHAAERPLVNAPVLGPREWYAVVLEFDDCVGRLLAHVFDGILITEPVGALDRVVHMPPPVVFAHVSERGADSALRGHGVAAGREHLGDAGGLETDVREAESCSQTRTAGAYDDDVVAVINKIVVAHAPNPILRIE